MTLRNLVDNRRGASLFLLMRNTILSIAACAAALGCTSWGMAADPDYSKHPLPVIRVETTKGPVFIELYSDIAPKHVERMKQLAKDKFYVGILFHRIVPDFVAQVGDPLTKKGLNTPGVGSAGSQYPNLPLEVSPKQRNTRGALAMARKPDPNSANSQFYFVLKDAPHLDGQYTVFGRVLGDGMSVIDKIQAGDAIQAFDVIKE